MAHAVEDDDAEEDELVEDALGVEEGKHRRHFLWNTAPSKLSNHRTRPEGLT